MQENPHRHHPQADQLDAVVKDPVCGMRIDPSSAAGKHDYRENRYYFCNLNCLKRFEEDPEKFLGTNRDLKASMMPTDTREYTCPMDPEVDLWGQEYAQSVEWPSNRSPLRLLAQRPSTHAPCIRR